jgi:hypothetical protein
VTTNESKISRTRGVRLAILTLLAVLVALMAVQAFSAKSAEAGPCLTQACVDAGGGAAPYNYGTTTIPPANDNFSAAKGLNQSYGYVAHTNSGNTTLATLEAGEPKPYSAIKDCGIYGISKSIWFKMTPNSNGQIKVSTEGSSFDTVLGLYKGSSLTSLQQVSCSNDNSSPNWTDNMTAGVAAGQTYYLQISGTGGLRSGAYKLNVVAF